MDDVPHDMRGRDEVLRRRTDGASSASASEPAPEPENPLLDLPEGQAPPEAAPPPKNIIQAFQHFACLYIKYMQIFEKLEACYDGMVHPQKRDDVLAVLELVIRRIIELKHALVKWNPPNNDVSREVTGPSGASLSLSRAPALCSPRLAPPRRPTPLPLTRGVPQATRPRSRFRGST